MKQLKPFGRILFSLAFLIYGLFYFINTGKMTGSVPVFLPGGVLWVFLTGIVFILAAVSILTRKYTTIASFVLAVMLLIIILSIHLPAVARSGISSPGLSDLLKDTALAGAAFFFAGHYSSRTGSKY